MARLPIASQDQISGAPVSSAVPEASDMGLHALARGIDAYQGSMDKISAQHAQQALDGVNQAYTEQYAKAQETYQGDKPGFAQTQGDILDTQAAKARAGLKGDVALAAFNEGYANLRNQHVTQALDYEGHMLGHVQAQQQAAAQTARIATQGVQFSHETQDGLIADQTGGAQMAPDYVDKKLSDFDARSKALIDAAPEIDKAALQGQLTSQRVALASTLYGQQYDAREQQVQTAATQGLQSIYNRVSADPSYATKALLDGQAVTDGLPLAVRAKVQAQMPSDILDAVGRGIMARKDIPAMQAFLARDDVKTHLDSAAYQGYSGWVGSTEAAASMALDQQTAGNDYNNALARTMATGDPGKFDTSMAIKAYGPIEGPVKTREWQVGLQAAQQQYATVKNAGNLSWDQFQKQMEVSKPQPDDPMYAVKMGIYQQALTMGKQVQAARTADPSGFDAASQEGTPRWQAAEHGEPGAAKSYADWTLARQAAWGMDATQQRILPAGYAKSIVTGIAKAPPDQRDDRMMQAVAQAKAFGPQYEGQVLKELQSAGLDGRDAAIMHASDGSSVVLGQYGRAVEVMKGAPKFDKSTQAGIDSAVSKAFADFGGTYGYSADGQIYADNLKRAITVMTQAGVHDGRSANEAAKQAVQLVAGNYVVASSGHYRLPADVAGQSFKVVPGVSNKAAIRTVSGDQAVQQGAYATLRDYGYNNPKSLYAARFYGDDNLTDDQRRDHYGAQVIHGGYWINTDDDAGLKLVMAQGGRIVPVLDASGKPVVKTWTQLTQRAAQPVSGGH